MLDLVASSLGVVCFPAGTLRKISSYQCSNQKRDQRNPVLWICNCERVERRQEEKVKTAGGYDRKHHRVAQAPVSRREQHCYQEDQRNRCGIDIQISSCGGNYREAGEH